jgi:hypothetical protein
VTNHFNGVSDMESFRKSRTQIGCNFITCRTERPGTGWTLNEKARLRFGVPCYFLFVLDIRTLPSNPFIPRRATGCSAMGRGGLSLRGGRVHLCDTARTLPERIAPWFFRCHKHQKLPDPVLRIRREDSECV